MIRNVATFRPAITTEAACGVHSLTHSPHTRARGGGTQEWICVIF